MQLHFAFRISHVLLGHHVLTAFPYFCQLGTQLSACAALAPGARQLITFQMSQSPRMMGVVCPAGPLSRALPRPEPLHPPRSGKVLPDPEGWNKSPQRYPRKRRWGFLPNLLILSFISILFRFRQATSRTPQLLCRNVLRYHRHPVLLNSKLQVCRRNYKGYQGRLPLIQPRFCQGNSSHTYLLRGTYKRNSQLHVRSFEILQCGCCCYAWERGEF